MPWKRILAVVTGEIEETLLAWIEYLLEESRVLRDQLDKRLKLPDPERKILAEKAILFVTLMADTVTIVKPATIHQVASASRPPLRPASSRRSRCQRP